MISRCEIEYEFFISFLFCFDVLARAREGAYACLEGDPAQVQVPHEALPVRRARVRV